MPNWCEGNIRLRGKRAAIMRFLRNELECVGYLNLEDGLQSWPVVIDDYDNYAVVNATDSKEGAKCMSVYIKGTHRNFIDCKSFELYFPNDKEEIIIIVIENFRAAWEIKAIPYLEKAMKYGIDIRIVGFECGMQFAQDIEIVGGEIVKDREIKYNDWLWECPMPRMGG